MTMMSKHKTEQSDTDREKVENCCYQLKDGATTIQSQTTASWSDTVECTCLYSQQLQRQKQEDSLSPGTIKHFRQQKAHLQTESRQRDQLTDQPTNSQVFVVS